MNKKTPRDLDEAKTVRCRKCGDLFLHQRSLDRHLVVEHGPRLYYRCRRCEHKNNRRDNLRYHYRDCHPTHVDEVKEIRGETCEDLERSAEAEGDRRKKGHLPPKKEERDQPTPVKSVAEKREAKTRKPVDVASTERNQEGGQDRPKDDGGSSWKRSMKESPEDRRVKKSHKSVRQVSCTVSRAPEDGSSEVAGSAPRQVPVAHEAPALAAITTEAVQAKDPAVAVNPPPEIAAEIEVPGLPLSAGEIEEMAEIALSPTPMSCWEPEETSPPEVVQPTPGRGGKPISIKLWGEATGSEETRLQRDGVADSAPTLRLEKLLPGQAVKIKETRETYLYREDTKVLRGKTQRQFDVVYLRPAPAGTPSRSDEPVSQPRDSRIRRLTRSTEQEDLRVGSPLTREGLEEAMIGRVTKITETSTRLTYAGDQKIMEDTTERVFDVAFLAGVAPEK